MCCAPAATCCRMSASTTSRCTTRNTPFIDRHNRAMAAEMLAAAAGFRVTGDQRRSPSGSITCAYFASAGRPARSGTMKFQPRRARSPVPAAATCRRQLAPLPRSRRRDQSREPLLEFAAENRLHAELAQIRLVHRGVQPVETKMRAQDSTRAPACKHCDGQPRGRVHRNVERNQVRLAHRPAH